MGAVPWRRILPRPVVSTSGRGLVTFPHGPIR
jgi:hypothetical protein